MHMCIKGVTKAGRVGAGHARDPVLTSSPIAGMARSYGAFYFIVII